MLRRCLSRWQQPARWSTRLTQGRFISTKPYYITTPIFYPNAVPHIGHLYSLVIADIFARYQRLLHPERSVEYLAGTDEHGLKIQKAAEVKGLPPNDFCNQLSSQFRSLGEKALISNTMFTRTTSPSHYETVQNVWRQLNDKGLIYKGDYSGWYSVTDESFYTNGQVTTANLPTGEVTVSTETGSVVEWQQESNYMFRLSQFQRSLLDHYQQNETIFPPQHQSHIVQILAQPLDDLSISRPASRLSWGIPVPDDPAHTIYVWFDALLIYLSGIGYKGGAIPSAWPVDLQIIGKDILRFHAIYLPAILQALGLPLQKQLLAHAHWTVEQKKMSKSVGNVADPIEAIDDFGIDIVRFYLSRVGGKFRDDTDWSQEQLEKHSNEIRSLLGNYFMRITSKKIIQRLAGTARPTLTDVLASGGPNTALLDALKKLPMQYRTFMDKMEMADAISSIIDVLRLANKTINDIAPWSKTCPPEQVYATYVTAMEVLRVSAILLQPITPMAAGRLLDGLEVSAEQRCWAGLEEQGQIGELIEGSRIF